MTKFIPGLKLSRDFYHKKAKPILKGHFPKLNYSAALIGHGSEVLGFDTSISSDHDWGPRFILFLSPTDYKKHRKTMNEILGKELPEKFMGYSVSPDNVSDTRKKETLGNSTQHRIEITTTKSYFQKELGIDPFGALTHADWLTFPNHRLLALTSGEVFWDGLGEINKIRNKLRYYPKDVWLYILASQWNKIRQEEAFAGRTNDVGDVLGTEIITSRIVKHIMELCFIMERRYMPYIKWFGTAFSTLKISKTLTPILKKVLISKRWKESEKYLSEAYKVIAKKHNGLKITRPMNTKVRPFFDRPYLVIGADKFASEIKKQIKDKRIRSRERLIGSLDQYIDSTEIREDAILFRKINLS